ncbi:four-jointed box protein 1-like [Mercenaria mercenaria]|uniref:four-jointed box protein 1-like n=1 Tax=Mercenaria mercenaria TaxID=6596 RepID=UPI00234EEA80|nr:four-jointed box protein 1-like [Mercenaria mercenaria]
MNRSRILQPIFFIIVLFSVLDFYRNVRTNRNENRSVVNYSVIQTSKRSKIGNVKGDIGLNDSSLTKNGIFWSDLAETFVPKGLTLNDSLKLVERLRSKVVTSLTPGTVTLCGNSKGGKVILEDGTIMCAKYKRKWRSVYAEALAYYLSRLLRLDNVPEVILASTDPYSERWKRVNISALSWQGNETVALVAWQRDCRHKTMMPQTIRNAFLKEEPVTNRTIHTSISLKRNSTLTAELIQWGTIIIFDNLIGHYDRLIQIHRTDQFSGTRSLHNSIMSSKGKIWLIDHERAFFYYQERYNMPPTYFYKTIIPFYDKILKTMCVFQSSLVERLQMLSEQPSPFKSLWDLASLHEPLMDTIPKDLRSEVYAKLFNLRLKEIMSWIRQCK